MKHILLTGASGFVGLNFLKMFKLTSEYQIHIFDRNQEMQPQLQTIDTIIHCAGLAHSPHIQDRGAYINANFELTKNLAIAAKAAGVKTFIFLSTIKVLGEYNREQNPIMENASYFPTDFYSESKVMAEEFLKQFWQQGLVILRPVVIYGPGVKGNFQTLAKYSHLPLPLGGIKAKRSVLFVGNLIERISAHLNFQETTIIENCADQTPLSISEMIKLMAQAQNRKYLCFYFPEFILKFMLILLGKSSIVDRLMKNFIVSNTFKTSDAYSQKQAFEISFN
jgi:nucleoside-diphosphate-sugar epimerase